MGKAITLGLVLGATLAPGFNSVFRTAKERAQGLKSTLSSAQFGATAAANLEKLGSRLDRMREAQSKFGTSNVKLATRIKSTEKQLSRARETAARYGVSLATASSQHVKLAATADRASKSLARLRAAEQRKAVREEAKGQILGAIGMAAPVVMATRQAIKFESAMADVQKVVNFDTPQQFKEMGKDLLNLSTRIPMTAEGLAKITAAAGQSGIAQNELLSFTETAAKMGIAFDITSEQAGTMMAAWRAGLGLTQPRVVALADAANYLSNNMNAKAGDIGEVIKRQGAVAMSAGLAERQVAALSAALLTSDQGPEIAATAMKNMTNALTKGFAATKQQRAVFSMLGIDMKKMARSMQKDAEGTILSVLQRIAKAPKEMQSAIVSQAFGEESKGAIMPLLANLDNLRNAFKMVADETKAAGSMEAEFKARSATTENNLQLLGNQATKTAVTFGSILLPAVNTLAGGLGKQVGTLGDLAERYPRLAQVVTFAAVGMVGFRVATLSVRFGATLLMDNISTMSSIFNFFRPSVLRANIALLATRTSALGAALGVRGLNLALLANPIGLIVAGLAVGAFLVYKYWGPIKSFFTGLWDGMREGMQPVLGLFNGLGAAIEPVWQAAKKLWDVVSNFFTATDQGESKTAESWGKRIGKVVGGAMTSVIPGASLITSLAGTSQADKHQAAPPGDTAKSYTEISPVAVAPAAKKLPSSVAEVASQRLTQPGWESPQHQALLRRHGAITANDQKVARAIAAAVQAPVAAQTVATDLAAAKAQSLLADPKWQSPQAQALLKKYITAGGNDQAASALSSSQAIKPAAPAITSRQQAESMSGSSPGGNTPTPSPAPHASGMEKSSGAQINNTFAITGVGVEHVAQMIKQATEAFSRDLESKIAALRDQQMRVSYGG